MLALEPGRTVSADRLAEGLWGESLPPSAAKMVQLYVSRLRRALDGDAVRIVTRGRGYALELAEGEVDAVCAERLVQGARPREGLGLWRGGGGGGPPVAGVAAGGGRPRAGGRARGGAV